MILNDDIMKMIEPHKDIVVAAAMNNGKGAYPINALHQLTQIYYLITKENVCSTCNRDWLWRIGIWYLETIDNKPKEVVDVKKKRTRSKPNTL